MEFIWIVGGLIVGIVLFLLLNELFDVYYFGCSGVSATFTGCWIAGAVIVFCLGFIAKWIIIIGIIIWILSKLFKGKANKSN